MSSAAVVRPAVRVAALGAVLLLSAALTACGTDSGGEEPKAASSASSGPSGKPGAPDCDEMWSEGGEIPRSYKGCNDDGAFVAADVMGCSSGQRFVRFDDHFYGVLGGLAHETESSLADDVGYRDAVASCRA